MDDYTIMNEIANKVGKPAMFEQLAEECCELAQASLKMARILRKENPTPVSIEEAERNFIEEFADVNIAALYPFSIIEYPGMTKEYVKLLLNEFFDSKINRWYDRIHKEENDEHQDQL